MILILMLMFILLLLQEQSGGAVPAFFIDVPYIFFNTFLVAMLGEAEDPKQHMGQFCLKT